MKVLAHRGLWGDSFAPNSVEAIVSACERGLGIEIDIRDDRGSIVVSHDPPSGSEPGFREVAEAVSTHGHGVPIAVNVKADGLAKAVGEIISGAGLENAFLFDMSVPDAVGYLREGLPCFSRVSEIEPVPAFAHECSGLWVDCFESDWTDGDLVASFIGKGKSVCLVSPELHGRGHREAWEQWASWEVAGEEGLMICTDFPEEARDFFP